MKIIYSSILALLLSCTIKAQTFNEILGRPTDSAVTMSILFDQDVQVYWEIGTASATYTITTSTVVASANVPLEFDFLGLLPNTKYYYRTRYRLLTSSGVFNAGAEHTFYTRKPRGTVFNFAVEADPHLDTNTNPASYTLSLQNMLSAKPDFMIDLGDNFMSEKEPIVNKTTITDRTKLFRPYFGTLCHSAPLFITIGNHEGELGWRLNGTDSSMPVLAANIRKLYYPNPYPNNFYTGNSTAESYVGLRENYYSWEWGNALFVVIDPYWYTTVSNRAGWGWTLGTIQYNWFKNTIQNSTAKFKFVFCHQLVGGNGNDARGGTEYVDYFEMGGKNADSTWGFATKRPGWAEPIHSLLVNNNASIYFHGHDHFYGKQQKDCIIYQEVPQPSSKNINSNLAASYGYLNGVFLPSRGYLNITVGNDSVKVDYVKTYLPTEENGSRHNKDIAYSYSIGSCSSGLPINLLSINGHNEQNVNIVKWVTSSEINNSHFDIERSEDGIEFAKIGETKSAGNTNQNTNYSFTDKAPFNGTNYYRLKQWDFNGEFQYSKIISIESKSKKQGFTIYPNPAIGNITVQSSTTKTYNRTVEVVDMIGRRVTSLTLPANQNTIKINTQNIVNGMYFVSVNDGNGMIIEKLVIKK
ncbi:MAG: T9SS type A sorting domain-containing protein [Bacteroidetes bacterium]|nr:T9SS type A sorting domain-containing protein [Bacteroidota bacterium]